MNDIDALRAKLRAVEKERDEWHERYRQKSSAYFKLVCWTNRLLNKYEKKKSASHKGWILYIANQKSAEVAKAAAEPNRREAARIVREHIDRHGAAFDKRGVRAGLVRALMDTTGLNKNSCYAYINAAIAEVTIDLPHDSL